MRIGELALRAEVGVDTVRYYERQGLLPVPERQVSGYRTYGIGDAARLRFIRRASSFAL
jgi:MerR family transcriptional regulator, copper efflux regulator